MCRKRLTGSLHRHESVSSQVIHHLNSITAEESHGHREGAQNREEHLQAGRSLAAERNLQEGSPGGNQAEVLLCLGILGHRHQPPDLAIRYLHLFLPVC